MAKQKGSRFGAKLAAVVAFALSLIVGSVVGLVLLKRAKTGKWALPNKGDLVVVNRIFHRGLPPSKVVFLNKDKITLFAGDEDAPNARSTIIARHATKYGKAMMPRFSGSKRTWRKILACVRSRFRYFDVEITDKRPTTTDNYIMVIVAGQPKHIGARKQRVSGLAPFNTTSIPKAVVFAFSDTLGNRVRATCETITMEVAHAYGLDHGYSCKDVTSYRTECGRRGFLDKDIPCGESKPRVCADGNATQNSYARLMTLLGPAKPRPAASNK